MIKKHDEGYALPFVLVVSVVMCIIATTVMTFSLNNLQSQQNTIERMQGKYEATAILEQILGAVAQNKAVVFDDSDTLKFLVESDMVTIASGSADKDVWIVIQLAPKSENVNFVETFKQGANGALTLYIPQAGVMGPVEVVKYEIVDMAAAFSAVGLQMPQTVMPGEGEQ